MVLVEIYVAAIDKNYDFRLDTTAAIGDVIEEICDVVNQKEDNEVKFDRDNLVLSVVSNEIVMNRSLTLNDYNVISGMKLILV